MTIRVRIRPVLACAALAVLAVPAFAQDPASGQEPVPTFEATGVAPAPRPAANRATAPALQPLSVPGHLAVNPVPEGGYARVIPAAPNVVVRAASAAARRKMGSLGIFGPKPTNVPAEAVQVNSNFGIRRDPINGSVRLHAGVDLHAALGESVGASLSGIVGFAGRRGGYGNLVVIDHGNGISTFYGHLSQINVVAGETVVAGQVIGYAGSTGHSTGPHLHYEVRALGRPVNPTASIEVDRGQITADGRVVTGPALDDGDQVPTRRGKNGQQAVIALPLYQSADTLSNY